MNYVLPAAVFGVLWILTFFPAWYLLIKLAMRLRQRPLNYAKSATLFILYEGVIILPYVAVLWVARLSSGVWGAASMALLLLVGISAALQLVDLQKLKQTLWNVYARFYDSLLHFYPYKELVGMVGKRADEYIRSGSTVADIGCGTGNISLVLLERHPEVQLMAVEPSKPMLQRAKKKIGAGSSVQFINTDAAGFLAKVPDGSLDVVVMNNVLYTILNRKQFWQQLSVKLSNDGVAVMANPDREGSRPLVHYHNQNASRWQLLRPGMILVGVIDDLISQLSGNQQFLFSTERELREELESTDLMISGVERCYGGRTDGIDILFTVHRKTR